MSTRKSHFSALWLTSSSSLETLFQDVKGLAVGPVAVMVREDMPCLDIEKKGIFGVLSLDQVD